MSGSSSAALKVFDPTAGTLPEQRWEEIAIFHERFYRDQDAHLRWAETGKRGVDYFEGRQWTAANMAKLLREGRPVLTINKVRPLVNLVLGYHLNNQTDWKAAPTNDATGTADMARVQSQVLKNIADINDVSFVDAEVHLDGIISGRGWFEIQQDYEENIFGECQIRAADPFMVMPDSDATEYDPNGQSHGRISQVDWVSADEVEAWYGAEAADRIRPLSRSGVNQTMPISGSYSAGDEITPLRTFGMVDDRGSGLRVFRERGAEWVDTYRKIVRRLRVQHWVRAWRWAMVDLQTGDRRWIPDTWTDVERAKARLWAAEHGIPVAMQRLRTRRLRWTHIIGDVVVFDKWSEYDRFTLVPFFPYFRGGITQGMVEPLLDMQDEINVRRAARLNMIMRASNSGWMIEKGSLTPQEKRNLEQNGGRAGFTLEYDTRGNTLKPPAQITPQQSPVSIKELEAEAENDMREIAGINQSALGQSEGANTSGRAVLARQQQTVIGLEGFRSNWKRSKRLAGRAVLAIVQNFYTQPRLLRIVGENQSNPIEMMINVEAADGVINDVTQGRFAVTVDETSLTDAFLDAQFNELITMMQQGIPVPPEFLVDASSIGRKEELRARILQQQQQQAQAAAQGAVPGQPPAAAAPDAPGAPSAAPPQAGPPMVKSNPPQPRLPS